MTIQFVSDLHLEFPQNQRYLKNNPIVPQADVLILAGDIVPFSVMEKYSNFWDFVALNFDAVYWVPGNHEYYHFDLATKTGSFCEAIRENVFLVNNYSIVYDDVKLIFSTMWTKISPVNEWMVSQSINDFYQIKFNGKKITTNIFNELHEESIRFLQETFTENREEKTVVATHHVPTFYQYPEKYKGDALNDAFAVEMFEFIEKLQPNYWIYGHSHFNTPDFEIGKTQLITNQLGYVQYNEQINFNPVKTFSI